MIERIFVRFIFDLNLGSYDSNQSSSPQTRQKIEHLLKGRATPGFSQHTFTVVFVSLFFLDQNFALFSVNNSTGGEHLFLNLIHLCSHRNPRLLLMPKSVLFDVKSSGRKNLRLRSRKNPWGVSLQQFNPPGSHQSQIYGHFLSSYTIFHFGANILEICVYFVPRVSSKAVWV